MSVRKVDWLPLVLKDCPHVMVYKCGLRTRISINPSKCCLCDKGAWAHTQQGWVEQDCFVHNRHV